MPARFPKVIIMEPEAPEAFAISRPVKIILVLVVGVHRVIVVFAVTHVPNFQTFEYCFE